MNKIPVDCAVCGSSYELNTRTIQKVEKGSISCYVCQHVMFEYDGCTAYYPFLREKRTNHINNDLVATGSPDTY